MCTVQLGIWNGKWLITLGLFISIVLCDACDCDFSLYFNLRPSSAICRNTGPKRNLNTVSDSKLSRADLGRQLMFWIHPLLFRKPACRVSDGDDTNSTADWYSDRSWSSSNPNHIVRKNKIHIRILITFEHKFLGLYPTKQVCLFFLVTKRSWQPWFLGRPAGAGKPTRRPLGFETAKSDRWFYRLTSHLLRANLCLRP